MDSLKQATGGKLIHSRCIEMKTYAADDDAVVVEGWLKDDRYNKVYDVTGDEQEIGPIHHMAIRIKVGGSPLTILDAEAEMVHVPLKFCQVTLDIIKRIIGFEITAGFGKRIRNLMGGVKGCAHLTHLLTVMSQAAFQGYLTYQRRNKGPAPRTLNDVDGLEYLLGSCRAWTEDGPKMEKMKAVMEGRKNPDL